MRLLLKRENIISYTIEGQRYDIGSKIDYLKTIVEFGLKRKEFADQFRDFLKTIVADGDELKK
jgi:UTP--glucose-1-phosphate uridylyltransferase